MRSRLLLCLAAATSATAAGWEPLGPFGGSAAIVLVDRRDALLAATSNAQIFRSEDNGDSWRPLPFPAQFRATLHALAVDRQNPGVYYAGLASESSEYSGILRSSDSGLTWERMPHPALRDVWSIAIWQQDSQVIAAGTEKGILLTRDGGATWQRLVAADDSELKPVVSLTFDPWDSKILYAGTPHLAWKTVDGGVTWQSIHNGMLDDSDVFSILVDDRRRSRIFAATCGGIYRSLDGGGAWTKLTEARGASFRTYHITQDPTQPNVLLAGTTWGLVKSVDSGATWRRLSVHSTRWIAFDPARPNRVFVATDEAGLFRSDDGGESFQAINQGFSNGRFASLTAVQNAVYVTALTVGASSVLRRSDGEPEWELAAADTPSPEPLTHDARSIYDVVTADDGSLLASTPRGLATSHDAGRSWQPVPGILSGATVRALCKHPTRQGVVFASLYREVFRSVDGGRSWMPLMLSDPPEDISALLVVPGDPDRLFALSSSRGVYATALPTEQ